MYTRTHTHTRAILTVIFKLFRAYLTLPYFTAVVHTLWPAGQIQPATSRQVAHKVQQESLKYEKYWHIIHSKAALAIS